MKNTKLVFGLLVLICAFFAACENPIMEKWWDEAEPSELVHAPIIKTLPPEMVQNKISVIGIEYILFAEESEEYNGDSPRRTGINLTSAEKNTNDTALAAVAQALFDNSDYLLVIYGHAIPVTNDGEEIAELIRLSRNRANAVEELFMEIFNELNEEEIIEEEAIEEEVIEEERVFTSGYDGERYPIESSFERLNQRVELILFKLD